MKSAKKRQKSTRKRSEFPDKYMSDAVLIASAASLIVADYLEKNPDLMAVIARTHKKYVGMYFKNGK